VTHNPISPRFPCRAWLRIEETVGPLRFEKTTVLRRTPGNARLPRPIPSRHPDAGERAFVKNGT